tara:strand:- start:2777 stop:3487 length:711 start_codon:yes stop_codon:yes gene_type:complete
MKNLIIFFTFFTCVEAYAQSISVEAQQTEVDPNCCMTLLDDIGTKIAVSNLTDSTLDIKVSRQVISSTQGTINYFCWTACYGSQTSVSPQSKSLGPQQVDNNSFEVHFDNLEIEPANASIKYCAFVESNPSDSSCTIVNYSVGTISNLDDFSATYFSDFHPNPTSSTTFLDYNLNFSGDAEIVVTDMLGNVVFNKNIINHNGILKFDVSDTNKGLYFANIFIDGELKTIKRLVVSK